MKIINVELDIAVSDNVTGEEVENALKGIVGNRIRCFDIVGGEGVTAKPNVKKAKPEIRQKRKYTRRVKSHSPVVVPKQPSNTERVIGTRALADGTQVTVTMRK